MIHETGDLFATTAPAIGHGVNCQGAVGAGIALQFKKRWYPMFVNHAALCESGQLLPGTNNLHDVPGGPTLVNMATQWLTGPDARIEWVRSCANLAIQVGVERSWAGSPCRGSGVASAA